MRQSNALFLALLLVLPAAGARADDGSAAQHPTSPAPKPASKAASRAASSQASRRGWLDHGFVGVNGSFQSASWDFSDRLAFTEYLESGESRSRYEVKGGPGWSAGGAAHAWRNIAVGVSVSRFTRTGSADLSASIPHPFFFGQPREIAGLVDGVRREETGVHVSVNWVANVGRRLVVSAGGGPSFFSVTQGFAAMPQWEQAYPYDTATFTGADRREASESVIGYNVGLDVAVYLTRTLGLGVETRYSRARTTVSVGSRLEARTRRQRAGDRPGRVTAPARRCAFPW